MIRKLNGIIDTINTDSIIINVSGVGYGAFCSANTLRSLPNIGESTSLFIETHVREDHIHLFGFTTTEEQEIFQTLIKISGVGTKMALAILSVLTPTQLINAIAAQDQTAFKTVSGVGPKLANRITTELKGKFNSIHPLNHNTTNQTTTDQVAQANKNINDAIAALTQLGYNRINAYEVITKIAAQNDNTPLDILIKTGLQELGKM